MNISSRYTEQHPSFSHSEDELISWLQSTSMLQQRAITGIIKKPARRLAALISLDDGTTLFVKKLFQGDHLSRLSDKQLTREVHFLRLMASEPDLSSFQKITPILHMYFPEERILLFEGLGDYSTLRDDQQASLSPLIIETIAEHLANCHKVSQQARHLKLHPDIYHQEAPIPTYGRITPEMLANAPGRDYGKYIRIVQGITQQLRELKASWTQQCLIHGDFKFDNIMIKREAEPQGAISIRFVDWELNGWGDPLWDVGSLVGQWLLDWIMSITMSSQSSLQQWLQDASVPFAQIRSAITCFVEQYMYHIRDTLLPVTIQTYQQVVKYAGAFLLHRALATMEIIGSLTPRAYCYSYVGKTLIEQPQLGIQLLFTSTRYAS